MAIRVDRLEDRCLLTVTWDGGGPTPDWADQANWSDDQLPGSTDDVYIPAGFTQIVHSTGADTVNSIVSDSPFVLSGGSLTVSTSFEVNSSLSLAGGLLSDTTVNSANTVVVDYYSSLSNVVLNGDLDLTGNSSFLQVSNGLTLNGKAQIGPESGSWPNGITFAGTQTIDGDAEIVFGNHFINHLYIITPETTVTLSPTVTVSGGHGFLNPHFADSRFVNQGTIAVSSTGRIDIGARQDGQEGDAGSFVNEGSLLASTGALLYVHTNEWSSSGDATATDTGTVAFLHAGTNTGTLHADGGVISLNGDWTSSGAASATQGGTLNFVHGSQNGAVTAVNGIVNFTGIWTNSGAITLTDSALQLQGSGELSATVTADADSDVTISGSLTSLTVTGLGRVALYSGTLHDGTLNLDPGQTLYVDYYSGMSNYEVNCDLDLTGNSSFLQVANGLTLNGRAQIGPESGSWPNGITFAGTQTIDGDAEIVFGNHFINHLYIITPETTVTLSPTVTVSGGHGFLNPHFADSRFVNQGTIAVSSTGRIDIGARQDGAEGDAGSFVNEGSLLASTGGLLYVHTNEWSSSGDATATSSGTVAFLYAGTNTGTLHADGGVISLNGDWTSSGTASATQGGTLNFIHGSQNGAVTAVNGTVNFTGIWTDSGAITLTDSALQLQGSGELSATVTADADSDVTINGSLTSLTVTGLGRVALYSGTLHDGTLNLDPGQTLYVDYYSGLSNYEVNCDLDLTGNSSFLQVANGLTLNGRAQIGPESASWPNGITFAGTQTIDGDAEIVFGNHFINHLYIITPETTVTLSPTVTVSGGHGFLNPHFADSRFVNQGTIAVSSTGRIDIGARQDGQEGDAGSFVNEGSLLASTGALLYVHTNEWSSSGDATATSSGTVAFLYAGTNTGTLHADGGVISLNGDWTSSGTASATQGGTLNFVHGSQNGAVTAVNGTVNFTGIWTNSGAITLTDSALQLQGSGELSATVTADADSDVTINGSLTSLTVTGLGRVALYSGTLHDGTLNLDPGRTLYVDYYSGMSNYEVNCDLDLTGNSSFLQVSNGLTLNGKAQIGPESGSWPNGITFAGTQTIDGDAEIVFGNHFINHLYIITPETTVTLSPTVTVTGGHGFLNPHFADSRFVNQGTIAVSSTGRIDIGARQDGQEGDAGSFVNEGSLLASTGALLYVHTNEWSSSGDATATDTGTVAFLHAGTNTGTLHADGGVISLNGDWTSSGAASATQGGTLNFIHGSQNGAVTAVNGIVNFTGIWTNSGAITLTDSALQLQGSGELSATVTADADSDVTISGSLTSLTVTGLGRVALYSGTLHDGTLNLDPGQTLYVDYYSGMSNYEVNCDLDLTGNSSFLQVANGLTLNGRAQIGPESGSWPNGITFAGTQMIDGDAEIVFGNHFINHLYIITPETTVTLSPTVAVSGGHGFLNPHFADSRFVNQGTIAVSSTGRIDIGARQDGAEGDAGSFVNEGSLLASTGALLYVHTNEWSSSGDATATDTGTVAFLYAGTNTGTLHADGGVISLNGDWTSSGAASATQGGTLNFVHGSQNGAVTAVNGTVNFTGIWTDSGAITLTDSALQLQGSGELSATVTADADSDVTINGSLTSLTVTGLGRVALYSGTLHDGTLNLDPGRTLYVDYYSGMSNYEVNCDLDLTGNSSFLQVANGLTLNGRAQIGPENASWPNGITFAGTQTIDGDAEIVFGNHFINHLYIITPETTVTLSPTVTVTGGHGFLNPHFADSSFVNQGTIAVSSTGRIDIGARQDGQEGDAGSFVNEGSLLASTGALLYVHTNEWSSSGDATATDTGTVAFLYAGTNTGTLHADGGVISLNGNWSSSGALSSSQGGLLSLNGDRTQTGSLTATTGGAIDINGIWTNASPLTASSGGIINFNGSWSNSVVPTLTGGILNLRDSGTWSADSFTGDAASAVNFIGTFTTSGGNVEVLGGLVHFKDGALLVDGSMHVTPSARLQFSGGTLDDFTITNDGEGTWTGGNVTLINGSAFNNAGTFDDQTDGTFGSNQPVAPVFDNSGVFIKSGGNGVTNMQTSFLNSGLVEIQHGVLNIGAGYVQTGGSTVVTGGSITGPVEIQGGDLEGPISGDVTNTGDVSIPPSETPTTTTSYTQSGLGSLTEQIGGLTPGLQYGQIQVSGNVNLAGSLNVVLINNFKPHLNDQFVIIKKQSDGPISGEFAGLPEGETLFAGAYGFDISYQGGDGNDVTLTVSQVPVVKWDGNSDGDGDGISWNDPLNWDVDELPDENDDVLIDLGTNSFTVAHASGDHPVKSLTSYANLSVTGGQLLVAEESHLFGSLTLGGGTFGGSGDSTVAGQFSWSAGVLRGAGSLTANGGTNFLHDIHNLEGGFHYVNPAGATATWVGGRIVLSDHSIFDNLGTFDVQADSDMLSNDAVSEFHNSGILTKSAGHPDNNGYSFFINNPGYWSRISVGVTDNSGTIDVQVGNLALGDYGYPEMTNTGSITGQLGTSIYLLGAHNTSGSLTGDYIAFPHNGPSIVSGTFDSQHTQAFNVTFTGSVLSLGDLMVSGLADVSNAMLAPAAKNLPSLNLNGTLKTDDALTVSGLFSWSSGKLQASGGGASLTANGGTSFLHDVHDLEGGFHYINPAGTTATWVGGRIILSDHSIFSNLGTLDVQGDADMLSNDAVSEFHNSGTLIKSAGQPNNNGYGFFINNGGYWSRFSVGITDNSGSIDVQVGNLALGDYGYPAMTNTGSITGQLGTSIYLLGEHNTSGSLKGDYVAFPNAGPSVVSGTFDSEHTQVYNTTFTGSVLGLGDLTVSGLVDLSNATLAAAAKNFTSLNLNGTLKTDDALTVSGLFSWSSGKLLAVGGAGSLMANGGTTFSSDNHILEAGFHYTNPAGKTATWLGGSIWLYDHSIFDNAGTLDVQCDRDMSSNDAVSEFHNSGTLIKSAGQPTNYGYGFFINNGGYWSRFSVGVTDNSGTIDVQVGNLALGEYGYPAMTNSGSITGQPGTSIWLLGAHQTSGSMAGDYVAFPHSGPSVVSGTFESKHLQAFNTTFTGSVLGLGDLTASGLVDLSSATLAPAARNLTSLNLNGTLKTDDALTVSGLFSWNESTLQGVGGVGSLTVQSGTNFSSSLTMREFNFINTGHAIWTGGQIVFREGGTFTNTSAAVFDDQIDGTIGADDAYPATFDNAGLFLKSGSTGTTFMNMLLSNSGVVQIDQGTLSLSRGYVPGGGSSSGRIDVEYRDPVPVPPGPDPIEFGTFTQTVTGLIIEQIKGLTPGIQYGQIVVSQNVTLAGGLEVAFLNGFVPAVGNSFLVLKKLSAGAISGEFSGKPEGQKFVVDDLVEFQISYQGGDGNDVTLTVTRILQNPPIITLFDGSFTYRENGAAILVDTDVDVTDDDSPDFGGGQLTVQLTTNANPGDRLSIRHQGTGVNKVGTTASNEVTYSGITIGSFTGGTGTTPLVVTFTDGVSKTAVRAVMRNLLFSSTADNPAPTQTIELKLADGDGAISLPVSKTIIVTPVNDKPVLTDFGGNLSYTEDGPATVLAPLAMVIDPDSANFDLGRLIVKVAANGQTSDLIAIPDQGTGGGQIGVSGADVTYEGEVIGSFTGTRTLTVTFNAAATRDAVQALLRAVTFSVASNAVNDATRTISATVSDGDGGTSVAVTLTVSVTPLNDAPFFTAFDPDNITYRENGAPLQIDSNMGVTDLDVLDFDTGVLTVTLTDGTANDRLAIRNQGSGTGQVGVDEGSGEVFFGGVLIGEFEGGTSGTDPLIVRFNFNAKSAVVQAVARNVTFVTLTDDPSVTPRTVRMQLTDGDGGTAPDVTKTINVIAVNDKPVLDHFISSATYVENASPVIIAPDALVSDVDSADFDGGKLVVRVAVNAQSTDLIGIHHQGTESGQIGVNGSEVSYSGTVIGTFSGTTALTILLGTAANAEAVQALLRNITYCNSSDALTAAPRTITAQLSDGDLGSSTVVSTTVNVAAVNDKPVVGAFDGTITYKKGASPVRLDTNATAKDPDLLNFNGGVLTFSYIGTADSDDRLSIIHQGTGNGQVGLSGVNDVTFGGLVIGTYSGGNAGTALDITFNSDATQAAVQAVLRYVAFSNVATNPTLGARTISVVLTDGVGGISEAVTKTVNVTL